MKLLYIFLAILRLLPLLQLALRGMKKALKYKKTLFRLGYLLISLLVVGMIVLFLCYCFRRIFLLC